MAASAPMRILAGTAHPDLGRRIAEPLQGRLSSMRVRHFADGEIYLSCDESVRGVDAYVVQPTCPPVDDSLIELLICIDALRRASARRITAVIPYFGYARQEKRDTLREPITARLVADLLECAGANRVMVMDLHSPAIQGFFRVPVDHLTAVNLLCSVLSETIRPGSVVVSPDEGGVKLARRYAQRLDLPLAVVYASESALDNGGAREVAGDVGGACPIIVEDMITTGSSVLAAVDALLAKGCAPSITVVATHNVMPDRTLVRLCERDEIQQVIVTDTVPQKFEKPYPKATVVSVAGIFSEAIGRIHEDESITGLVDAHPVASS